MKIAVISDTHDHVEHIKRFVGKTKEMQINTVLHAGDYCSPFTIPLFEGLDLIGVFGNNDGDHFRLIQNFESIGGRIHNEFHELEIEGRHIALYHGTQPAITEALVLCGKYELVISGHTHQAHQETHGKTTSLNPGSLHGFDKKPTFAVYDTHAREVEIFEV